MRLKLFVVALSMAMLGTGLLAQNAARATTEATIKGKSVKVTYGRPALRGRDVLALAKPGMVWRLGMNEATEIQSAGDLTVGGKTLKAGKYSLWAKKTDAAWVLAFHPQTGVWGQPELTSGYVAEVPLAVGKAAQSADLLTISVADNKGQAALKIHWGTTELSTSFDVK